VAEDIPARVAALVRARRRIEAIKALREQTGIGLKEARDRVIAFERQIGIAREPSPVVMKSLLFWFVLIVVGLLIWWGSLQFQG
jgi:ribosomal protein L7/L12